MSNLNSSLQKFEQSLNRLISHNINIDEEDKNILDFSQKKRSYHISMYRSSFKELINGISGSENFELRNLSNNLKEAYTNNDIISLKKLTDQIKKLVPKNSPSKSPSSQSSLSFRIKNLPEEISDDINADLKELEKCFNADCFRASVILCGRLLETSLHRKYYEATKNDLLEKAPGIGLGNLIAKMKEKNIELDPAIAQQIHLINQIRIYSVHKKQQSFSPSKDQTNAIILYTIDIIKRLFT